mmetsp:Transcript_8029/g.33548  ORF Transcript_8029/g.33548 Transcript_8029/m.33548 type:complete len:292 (-) Transcript_8029:415-1290(-)
MRETHRVAAAAATPNAASPAASARHDRRCPPAVTAVAIDSPPLFLSPAPNATRRTPTRSAYVAPCTAASLANACGNSPAPYTGTSAAPTSRPKRCSDARYAVRLANPSRAVSFSSPLSASVNCTASEALVSRPSPSRSSAAENNSSSRSYRGERSEDSGSTELSSDAAARHSLPGAPTAASAASGSPAPTTVPSRSATRTTCFSTRISARFSARLRVLSRNTSARDAGTAANSPSLLRMFVASSALNSTYLCAPERTRRSTNASAPSARRGPERSRQNCRLIEPLGVAGEQ